MELSDKVLPTKQQKFSVYEEECKSLTMRTGMLTLLIAGTFAISCSDTQKDIVVPDPPDKSRVNLNELASGQETMYLGYQQNCDSTDFSWTGDTLVTRIVEEDGEFYMTEEFTLGSPSYQGPGATTIYPISSESGVVTLPQRQLSALFNFYGSDKIQLQPSDRIDLEQSGCLIATNDAIFVGDDIGHIEKFDFGLISLADKTVVSCVPVFDLDAYLIYDHYQLYLSHRFSSASFMGQPLGSSVWGWVMIK